MYQLQGDEEVRGEEGRGEKDGEQEDDEEVGAHTPAAGVDSI
jgi:hypothetical protein